MYTALQPLMVSEQSMEICGFCRGSTFKELESKQGLKLIECKNNTCKNVIDIGLRTEDVKHEIYKQEGKEPQDKRNI